jgi:hypothetical protein
MSKSSLKILSKHEIEKMEVVFKNIKLLNENAKRLFELAKSYFKDSKYFYKKGDFIRAFEAVVISWAYIDAGLNMKLLQVDKKVKKFFTI